MKVVNLDAYRKTRNFTLDGINYTAKGMSVGAYLDDDVMTKMNDESVDTKTKITTMVAMLSQITDVPREKLLEQDFETLGLIMMVAQGADLKPPESDEVTPEGEVEKNELPAM